MKLFGSSNQQASTPIGRLVDQFRSQIGNQNMVPAAVAGFAISTESLGNNDIQALETTAGNLVVSIEAISAELGIDHTEAQVRAAAVAGLLASDYKKVMSQQKTNVPNVSTENMAVVPAFNVNDALSDRSFSLEAYDERNNRDATIYSIAYNMQSARQDEFGETLFPTITLTPDNVGFGVTVNLMMVYNGVERKLSGAFEDFKKKNIIRAVADPDVLHKEGTKVVPVVRVASTDKFVAAGVIAPASIVLEGETISTAPLAVGKKLDLLALSQTDTLVAGGLMDQTDSLDPYITLSNVYVTVGNDVLKINTLNLPLANFTYSTQNNYRVMSLNFTTTSVLLNKNTKNVDGSALDDLASIVTNDLIVRLELTLNGTVNIETGETVVYGNNVSVYSVQNASGDALDLTAAPSAALVAAVAGGSIVGYDLQAYRTNMNRRQRGQFIDVTAYTQLYNVPLRMPITTLHPVTTEDQVNATDVQALITATRIRVSNEAVTALLDAATMLSQYIDARDVVGSGPDILGVGRFFVRPTYFNDTLDMTTLVDSLTSVERPADIQAAIMNKIRDYVFQAYRDSEYKAADDALSGGISQPPTVILATDPVLARYLMVTGDIRPLGNEFVVRVVSTLDKRMKGKIIAVFGKFDESRNTAPNVLNFGNMVWAPELVLTANISRGSTFSKETVVQPRYRFIVNCPIMVELNVSNIPDVLSKVAVNFNNI